MKYEDYENERLSAWAHRTWEESGQVDNPYSSSRKSPGVDMVAALVVATMFGIPGFLVIVSDDASTTAKALAGAYLVFILVADLLALLGIQLPKDGWND